MSRGSMPNARPRKPPATSSATEGLASALRINRARAVLEQTRNQLLLRGGLAAIGNSNIVPQTATRLLGL